MMDVHVVTHNPDGWYRTPDGGFMQSSAPIPGAVEVSARDIAAHKAKQAAEWEAICARNEKIALERRAERDRKNAEAVVAEKIAQGVQVPVASDDHAQLKAENAELTAKLVALADRLAALEAVVNKPKPVRKKAAPKTAAVTKVVK